MVGHCFLSQRNAIDDLQTKTDAVGIGFRPTFPHSTENLHLAETNGPLWVYI